MDTIKKIEANSMYGKINRQRPTDLEQAEAAVDMILRTPLRHRDFIIGIRALQNILDKAQNGPPQGTADGSIDEKTWNMLSRFLKACLVINEEGYNITSTHNCRAVEQVLDRINKENVSEQNMDPK